ncbi:MAG: hypothetical protein HRU15_12180 [Planctomycetes bacterium]|nr:hypothetical protein [Planctomycetota bacterium]
MTILRNLTFACILGFMQFTMLNAASDDDKIKVADIPAGKYEIHKLDRSSAEHYGPLHAVIDVQHTTEYLELRGMKDIAFGKNVCLSYKEECFGNISLGYAQYENGALHIYLHACYIGNVVLRQIVEE